MNHSTPGLPVHHQLPEFAQTHVHWVSDAIQPSHPLSSPSLPALNLSQHQGLSFPMSRLFASGGQSIGASASVLTMNIQGWFPLAFTCLILLSKGLSKKQEQKLKTNFGCVLPYRIGGQGQWSSISLGDGVSSPRKVRRLHSWALSCQGILHWQLLSPEFMELRKKKHRDGKRERVSMVRRDECDDCLLSSSHSEECQIVWALLEIPLLLWSSQKRSFLLRKGCFEVEAIEAFVVKQMTEQRHFRDIRCMSI